MIFSTIFERGDSHYHTVLHLLPYLYNIKNFT